MKRTKGISLIVLVVTIIVMIIIAGAIIISLSQTNVIDQAEYARERHNISVLEENLRLERQNILLEKHGIVKDEDVKVATILNLTEEDAINIATANSIPANMPAGTYYEIDGNRYATKTRETEREIALASRGIDRENKVLTDTYVVNDNLDVYYIISGTIESKPEIDDEKVVEILNSMFTGAKDEATAVSELKQELYIDDEEINNLSDMAYIYMYIAEDSGEEENFYLYLYLYLSDRIYLLDTEMMQFSYVNKLEKEKEYQYANKLEQVREELIEAFVGKELVKIIEDMEKENTGLTLYEVLNKYISDNCKSIKTANCTASDLEVTFEFGNGILGGSYFEFEYDDDDLITNVLVQIGS